jgi:hypothetical protein
MIRRGDADGQTATAQIVHVVNWDVELERLPPAN